MRDAINTALKEALKAQDKRRLSTLRLIQAAIKDRDIAVRSDGRDGGVSDAEILDILAKMIKQRQESIATYEAAGRMELAQQEREETEVIREFLPRQLSETETQAAAEETIQEMGATGLKDMGKVMGELKARYAGQMDFAKAGAHVKKVLGG